MRQVPPAFGLQPPATGMIATVTLNPSLDEWMQLPALRIGALNRATGFARYPGGKGINVSRVIRELGGKTLAFALAGGEDGQILRHLMNRLAIPHEFVTVGASTRNNYQIRTTAPRALTEINTAGPRVSPVVLRALERRLFQHAPAPQYVVLSGSLPPGVSPRIYQRWILRLRRLNIPSVLDASGPALQHGLRAHPWLIKPNREEAQELLERRLTGRHSLVRAVRDLLRRGAVTAILSVGRDGALMASHALDGVWLAQSPMITVNSSVGAGDSLVGGFLVGWARRRSLLEALRLGVACGTATVMTPGTELCHRTDVRRILPRVTIHRVG